MIHPSHVDDRFLRKMKKVGTLLPSKPDYLFNTPFEREIKAEVAKIVPMGQEFGTRGYWFRAVFYISLLFGCQYIWVTSGSTVALAVIFGVSQAFIGLNVQVGES